jgi:hypothetical protein
MLCSHRPPDHSLEYFSSLADSWYFILVRSHVRLKTPREHLADHSYRRELWRREGGY